MKRNLIYYFIGTLVASILFLGIVVSNASAQMTVTDIQAAIKAKGASWVAGENPISRLTLQEKKNLMGLLDDPKSTTHPAPTCQLSTVGLPPSIDWRNNGGNYVSAVKNQGMCSSCWAYASTAAAESAVMIANRTPNVNLDLMEAVLISCCTNCSSGVCRAGYLGPAADYLQTHGEPLQTCPATDCGYTCPNQEIKSWEWVTPSVDNLKAALANYGPLVAGMQVYSDFYNYMSGVYSYAGGSYMGGHAVTVIGYNDAGQYFIGKNSWDTSWGEAGFFRIAYSEVGGTSQFGSQTIAYHGGSAPSPTCQYPIGDYFAASGGTGNVQVSTAAGCAWSATSNAPWIFINSGSSGSGPGAVAFTVAANTTSSARTGTMTVPGGAYTVMQGQGSSQCTYSISSPNNSFTAAGGNGSISVTTTSGCPWTATSGVSWINITGTPSGSGNGTVSFSVAANGSTTVRTGTITIGGQTFSVTQAGQTCTYAISPTSSSPGAGGGISSVSVTSASGCAWTAASNTSWITINSGSSGSGNGTVSYTVAGNNGNSSRSGTMTIGGQTHMATQAGASCTYATSPTSQNLSADAVSGTVNVTSASGCTWSAVSNASWITVTGGASGSGNGTVGYSVTANTASASRTGTLTVAGQTFTATQQGVATCGVSLNTGGFNVTYSGRQLWFTVSAASSCSWSATANVPWITFVSGTSGSGSGTVTFSVGTNTGSARTGTISVNGSTMVVNQTGSTTCTYAISPTSQNFATTTSGTGAVNVTAASGCAWTAASAASWISINSGSSGSGNGSVSYTVAANPGAARTGSLTIANQPFTVTQAGTSPTCGVYLTTAGFNFGYTARQGSFQIYAATTCSWSASASVSWITINSGATGVGNGTVTFTVGTNTGSARTGTITIGTSTVFVNQAGQAPSSSSAVHTYAVNPTEQTFTASAGTGSVSATADPACIWTATSNASWLAVTSGSSGSVNGEAGYSFPANQGSGRTGTITTARSTFTVIQGGAAA